MPLIPDPNFKGKGKARALESIDLMSSNWPIDHDFQFTDYAFADSNYPAYHIGSDVNQTITLTNISDILGNTVETIEDLAVTVQQVSCDDPNEPNLPGDSNAVFPVISRFYPGDANSIGLIVPYTILDETGPGLKQTKLLLGFNFLGDDRVIRVGYSPEGGRWYAVIPGDLDLSKTVDMIDLAMFADHWRRSDCNEPDWCGRADINRSGDVGWADVEIFAEYWLSGPAFSAALQ